MKTKKEQIDEELIMIKLFSVNYATDLLYNIGLNFVSYEIRKEKIICIKKPYRYYIIAN
jgi:hypothetical protein